MSQENPRHISLYLPNNLFHVLKAQASEQNVPLAAHIRNTLLTMYFGNNKLPPETEPVPAVNQPTVNPEAHHG